jgi:hypothetical protein
MEGIAIWLDLLADGSIFHPHRGACAEKIATQGRTMARFTRNARGRFAKKAKKATRKSPRNARGRFTKRANRPRNMRGRFSKK